MKEVNDAYNEVKRLEQIIKSNAILHFQLRDTCNASGNVHEAGKAHRRGVRLLVDLFKNESKPFIYRQPDCLPLLVTCCYNLHVLSINEVSMCNIGILTLESLNKQHCTCQPQQG